MDLEKMTADFFATATLSQLTQDAGLLLRCPLLIVDDTFHVVSSYLPEDFHDAVFEGAIARGEITYEVVSMLGQNFAQHREGIFLTIQDSPYLRRFSLLSIGGMHVGYLVCVDIREELRQIPQLQMERIEAILSKQLSAEINRYSRLSTTAEEVLTHLLDGRFSSRSMFHAQAAATYLGSLRPERVALIDLGRYHSLHFGDDALKNDLQSTFYASHPFLYGGQVLLFLSAGHDLTAFDRLAKQYRLCTIISDPLPELYRLPQYYRAASEAMDYLLRRVSGSFTVEMRQLHQLLLLRELSNRPDLVDARLLALETYDRQNHTAYCLTLYTYLICHRSVQDTSARLFTHRNTILYRLRKLREDFALDFDDPDQTLPLLLSAALILLRNRQDQVFVQNLALDARTPGDACPQRPEQIL